MTQSGPHNHSALTAEPRSGAVPDTGNPHSPREGPSPRPGDLRPVKQAVADLRETLISSGLDGSGNHRSGNQGSATGAEALLAQIPALEAAARQLEALRDQAARQAGGDPAKELAGQLEDSEQIATQLVALQTEIARSQHLLQQGTEFWLGWAGLLGLDTGYTARGMVAPLSSEPGARTGRKVSLKG